MTTITPTPSHAAKPRTRKATAADKLDLSPQACAEIATRQATCPFIASALTTGKLALRNTPHNPLAGIDDVRELGNRGGGNLGEVLALFAAGNHARGRGSAGLLDQALPVYLFSLDFPGSQGAHPGHSGILQGDPKQLGSGRFNAAAFDRLLAHGKAGYITRSAFAHFIAENLIRDPDAQVFSLKTARLIGTDLLCLLQSLGPALFEKVSNTITGAHEASRLREAQRAFTKLLGENHLVASAGEFGLLFALLSPQLKSNESPQLKSNESPQLKSNESPQPNARLIEGEPALAVKDLTLMFRDQKLPTGWERWPKTAQDWVRHTTALLTEAALKYGQLRLGLGSR